MRIYLYSDYYPRLTFRFQNLQGEGGGKRAKRKSRLRKSCAFFYFFLFFLALRDRCPLIGKAGEEKLG